MDINNDSKKNSRREQLINAQMSMISTTGKISGEVKEILSCENKSKLIDNIQAINDNLKELVLEIYNISNALNLRFEEIVGEIDGSNV